MENPINFLISKYKIDKTSAIICKFNKFNYKNIVKNGFVWAAIFILLSTFLITSFVGEQNNDSTDQKILFYGRDMLGTWDIPEYGKYGREASGMFGLLPIYLTASGYKCEIIVDDIVNFLNKTQPDILIDNTTQYDINNSSFRTIDRYVNITDYVDISESEFINEDILNDVKIFVVTNINNSFSKDELKIIWNFVEKGGSLLVLGDHTNVGGVQKPLNSLIEPFDIIYRFDSALPIDSKFRWQTSYDILHHPITSNIKNGDELQISVGASLDISYTSFPVVIGKYAFSDNGDIENEDFAYLGDYVYNNSEQLGDIVLVAGSYFGSGKVLVFGDTSSFQNSALAYSYPFLRNIFNWLNNKKTGSVELIKITLSLILLISSLIVIFVLNKKHLSFTILPIALCVALLCSSVFNSNIIKSEKLDGEIVYIDASHGERFTLEAFSDKSLNGLILNLNRNGYLPIFNRYKSIKDLSDSKIIIFNAPTKEFTSNEVSFLKEFMSNGGFAVLATGYDDKAASQSLLNEFNIDIDGIPLGPVPYGEDVSDEYENETRFVDSWPITYESGTGISYYSFNFTWNEDDITDYHLMVFFKHGMGGLLLISDSQYLLDKNIESIYDYWPGNILMLKNIIDEFKEMEDGR